MKESGLHDKTRLEGFVKETRQDKTGWKSQCSHECQDWKKKSGLHDKTGLAGRVRPFRHVGWIVLCYEMDSARLDWIGACAMRRIAPG